MWIKRTGRELIKANEIGNRLVTYEDRPHYYDAWDINDYYTEKAYPIDMDAQITVLESGPVRTVIRVVHMYLDSIIQQDLIFYSQLDRIDLQYQIDWREKQILLRNYFPVNIHASEATYEIQYGNVKTRTTRPEYLHGTRQNSRYVPTNGLTCPRTIMDSVF